jgi:hypothetical protein
MTVDGTNSRSREVQSVQEEKEVAEDEDNFSDEWVNLKQEVLTTNPLLSFDTTRTT